MKFTSIISTVIGFSFFAHLSARAENQLSPVPSTTNAPEQKVDPTEKAQEKKKSADDVISKKPLSPLAKWFATSKNQRPSIPAEWKNKPLTSQKKIEATKKLVWNAYREGAIHQGWDHAYPETPGGIKSWIVDNKLQPKFAKLGEKTMPYVVLAKGEKPAGGWPIFICLHGGGANPNAPGPHAWSVNTREWQAQMRLTTNLWQSPGLYVIPRMADDREGRWYLDYNQTFIDRAIQQGILFADVNPNKVYLMGISEGGYAAYRLGSMMADRWAGSCAMAAAEPIRNAPPENFEHVAFRCGIGERDTMFNRIDLARTYFKRLDELEKKSLNEHPHFLDVQKGRGHGINYEPGPKWIAGFTRNPIPKSFHWTVIKQGKVHRNRLYWLALDSYDGKLPLKLTAEAKANNDIQITAYIESEKANENGKKEAVPATNLNLRVYLSNFLVDLSKKVTITLNGKKVFDGIVSPSAEAIILSTAERGDPTQVFPAQVKIQLKNHEVIKTEQ